MKKLAVPVVVTILALLLGGCETYEAYKLADQHKSEVRSLALLPLVVGDANGRIEKLGSEELDAFLEYFRGRFYTDFERQIALIHGITLELPGRDFDINVYNGMDLAAAARTLNVDAVLALNLTLYNEVTPGARGAQVAAAVVTTLFLGGYAVERRVAGYQTHYSYLGLGQLDTSPSFEYSGPPLPTIDEQRKYFVDSLLAYLDRNLPVSTDYVKPYKE